MFSNGRYVPKNGEQHTLYSKHPIHNSTINSSIPNRKTISPRMEAKIIMTILSITGVASYIWAIILNMGNWKSDVLFSLAVLFGILKVVRFGIRTYQDYKITQLDIKEKERQQEDSVL